MAKIEFDCYWYKTMQKELNMPKGMLAIKPALPDEGIEKKNILKRIYGFFNKLEEYQSAKLKKLVEGGVIFEEKDFLRKLHITVEYFYRKRVLGQNALMWSLYEILANELNGGQRGHKDQMHFPDQLYEQDLMDYAEREKIITKRKHFVDYYDHEGFSRTQAIRVEDRIYEVNTPQKIKQFIKIEIPGDTEIEITFLRSTSLMNTVEMAEWINMLFNRLAHMGVDLEAANKIEDYWINWKKQLNKRKVLLNDGIMTIDEYKENNPICEASGKYIGNGNGHLHHIKAIGMGGDRTKEPKKNYSSNWLHLHPEMHNEYHSIGPEEFAKRYDHLSEKIMSALSREYKPIQQPAEELDIF